MACARIEHSGDHDILTYVAVDEDHGPRLVTKVSQNGRDWSAGEPSEFPLPVWFSWSAQWEQAAPSIVFTKEGARLYYVDLLFAGKTEKPYPKRDRGPRCCLAHRILSEKMKRCRTLGFCLLLTATAHGQSDTEPVPDLGSRTSDGFLVKCYWVGTFMMVEKLEGQGVTDLFGQALSPVCGKSTTTASIIITEEVDNSGQRRAVVRAGTWASKFTGLHYWFKNGKRVGAGPGGSGGGRIPTSGEGAPSVSITYGENTADIHLGWTESDALAFDSKYLPLKLVMGGSNPLGIGPSGTHRQHLEVDTKEKTERRKAHVMGMMAVEEPVQAGRNTVIRQEWGDAGQ